MLSIRQGSIHLGRIAGIDLYLHWSWFVIAVIEIGSRQGRYTSLVWSLLEYLALFAIVLMHEFGHALACRQVGGIVDRIMLWPLGGVAYVNPPQRPGATLWSLAAGPLVNVALSPIIGAALLVARSLGLAQSMPDAYHFLWMVLFIDVGLFVFNILPIYPLDGGQILRSLLWFFIGRARSLLRCHHSWICGCGGAGGSRAVDALRLVFVDRRLHADELLERIQERASPDSCRKATTPRGLCLPWLRRKTACRSVLEMRAMQP
ncbi:MAG: M50 family metallopeptidase [Terracidiphilus sp.]